MTTAATGEKERKTAPARSTQKRPEPRSATPLQQKNRMYAVTIAGVFVLIFVTVMTMAVTLHSFESYLGLSGP
jgi:hypothetical protein